jgi:DNA mismatch endonuclease (patch repair protein)
MKSVRQKGTAPELAVRTYLHRRGLRFVLHPDYLPGRPDIVLPRRQTVVFVNGCFWHGHDCPHGLVRAKNNASFWQEKIASNRRRDRAKNIALRSLGWYVEVIWECQVRESGPLARLADRLLRR